MVDTVDVFPGEGEIRVTRKLRVRHECEICGEPAHFKHTFLLDNARRNPASSAYGRDNCSYCEDEKRYVCKEHEKERQAPDGYGWCSTFHAIKINEHMFLYWHELKEQPND